MFTDVSPRALEIYGGDYHGLVPLLTWLATLELRAGDVTAAQARLEEATRLVRPALATRERGLLAETAARLLRARGGPAAEVADRVAEAARAYEAAGPAYTPQAAALRTWLACERGVGPFHGPKHSV